MDLSTIRSVYPPHGQWPAAMGSWRVHHSQQSYCLSHNQWLCGAGWNFHRCRQFIMGAAILWFSNLLLQSASRLQQIRVLGQTVQAWECWQANKQTDGQTLPNTSSPCWLSCTFDNKYRKIDPTQATCVIKWHARLINVRTPAPNKMWCKATCPTHSQ